MSHRVVADQVPRSLDLADQARALAHETSDQKERRAEIVARQQIEQVRSPRIIGAIVIGERNLVRIAAREDCRSKKLRPRRQRGIGAPAPGKNCGSPGAGKSGKHCFQCKAVCFPLRPWYVRVSFAEHF